MSDRALKNYLQARAQLNRSFASSAQANRLFRVWREIHKNRALTLTDIAEIWNGEHYQSLALLLSKAQELGLLKRVYIVDGLPYGCRSEFPDTDEMSDVGSYYLNVRGF